MVCFEQALPKEWLLFRFVYNSRPMRRCLPVVGLLASGLFWAGAGLAARVQLLEVRHEGNTYSVRFETLLDAPPESVCWSGSERYGG